MCFTIDCSTDKYIDREQVPLRALCGGEDREPHLAGIHPASELLVLRLLQLIADVIANSAGFCFVQSKLNEVTKGGGKRLGAAEGSSVLGSGGSGRHSGAGASCAIAGASGAVAAADSSGLPAHQRRNKSVLSSAGAASLAGTGSNSSTSSGNWGYAAAGSGLSRASPQTSPRGIGSIGKATSSSSVLAEPSILPPPVTMPRPTEGMPPVHAGGRSLAPEGDGSFGGFAARDTGNSAKGVKKTLRFEPPSGPGSGTGGSGSGKAESSSYSSSSKQQGGWERQVI